MKNLVQCIGNRLLNLSKTLTNNGKFCGDVDTSPHEYLSNKGNTIIRYDQSQASMIKRELGILFLAGCLILASVSTALCRSPAPTIYVAGDGSGDFNCVGKDDHVQINQALKFVADNSEYTTVHLKGPFTYFINDTLLIGNNTTLEGDSTAVIKLVDSAGWDTMKPLILSNSGNNIVVKGFEVNVNHDGNAELPKGKGYYNVMYFTHCNNVKAYDMYMHDGHGDGLRIRNSENVQFYNNTIYKLGHDGLYAIECQNVEAWNNTITCRTNSALRIWNSNHVKFHDNVIDSFYDWSAGGPGIQIEKGGLGAGLMDDLEICNNTINNTYGPGIWLFNYDTSSVTRDQGKNVHIHHNIFYSTGTNPNIVWVGGIVAGGFNGTLVENNVFDGAYNAAVIHMYHPSYSSSYSPPGGYITTLRNNIIINTQKCTKDPSGGYGVLNYLSLTHKFVLENNCLYNNSAGNYKNCTATADIYVDPLFADPKNHDYHLQSVSGRWNGEKWIKDKVSSPCIDAGCSFSDYSNEPEDNGNRINIGRYGNTVYASLSGENHAPLMDPIPEATVKIGENLSITVKASDADGESLTYSASDLPSGASFDGKSGLFCWTPTNDQEGFYTISFKVRDSELNDSEVAKINVVKEEVPFNFSGKLYDIRLREASPEEHFSSKSFLDVGGMRDVGRYRDLIWFNISEYTNANEINSAALSLFWYYPPSSRSNDTVIGVYRPAAWNPDYVSWNKKDKGITWNSAGGDWYDKNGIYQGSTPYATLTLKASSLPDNRYCELNVTDLVKEYISGKYANTGFLIKASNESDNYVAFYSADCGNVSQIPELNITKRVTANATITGAKDNRLREASPEDVFSDKSFLDVGGTSNVGRYRDAILFNLSGYTSDTQVNSATLSLFWYYPPSIRPKDTVIEVYRPAAWNPDYVSWNKKDKGITWNSAGGDWYDKNGIYQGSTPYATLTLKASSLPDNRYCELNVTDLVKEYVSGKYANTGFLIKASNESDNYIAFYSSDCGNVSQVPKLNLVYS